MDLHVLSSCDDQSAKTLGSWEIVLKTSTNLNVKPPLGAYKTGP